MKLKYSKNVVGCKIKNEIFIHPELYKYPELYHAIVKHEQEHTDDWNLSDLKHDLFGQGLDGVKGDFYRFMFKHPRTFLGYLPLTKVGKYWAFDIPLGLLWLFGIGVGFLLLFNL